jgi:hypothetical protein
VSPSTIEQGSTAEPVEDRAWRWTVRALYTGLIAAELWVLFDWWRETPGGQLTLARWQAQLARLKVAAQECEGCAKRKAMLRAAVNRMHWQAERIIEGEDVPTQPEAEA